MSVTLSTTPASPRSKIDVAVVNMAGLDNFTPIYVSIEASGVDTAKSPIFVGAADGTGLYGFSHIFPSAGTFAIKIRKSSDDSQVATQNVTVS